MEARVMLLLSLFFVSFICTAEASVFYIQNGSNFLFRGGMPGFLEFEYHILVAELRLKAEIQAKEKLPESFNLIDLNLLNPNATNDAKHIKKEQEYFATHDVGTFISHPIHGEPTTPFNYSSSYVQQRALTFDQWSVDDLPAFIEQIHSFVTTPTSKPTVAYIHCSCGCDRTGEVSGSYYMAYKNMTLHDAHVLDKKIAGREININAVNTLYWYCFYLKYAKNYDLTCEP